MSSRAALEADHISKQFGGLQAVSDLSLNVNVGDIYGFIGPNGAGKTTSIRMMLGLIQPSAGTARVFGRDIRKEFKSAIKNVGALVEGPAFYPYMSGRRNLRLFGRLSGGVSKDRIQEVLNIVGLGRRGGHKVKGFSQGMRQRLGIALALLNRPRLLVLDEPTNGLDPQGTREVRNLVRRIRDQEGTTVFLSSHLLSEMEMICDRIGIIYRGKIIEEGRMDDLIGTGSDVVNVRVDEDQDRQCRDFLREKFAVESECVKRGVIEFPRKDLALFPINKALIEAGFKVSSISARHRSLEEFFVGLTGESQDVY
ncbi:MAG TPA: ABC transporter ATP-binding protein [bacterium]|nr:ABC transporter ATP-binding protein [bacterium]